MTVKHPVLAQLALGYAPLYDKQRQVMGTRLSLLPLKPDAELPAAAVLAAVLEGLPPEHKPGVLGLPQEAALNALLGAGVPPHLALELPAFLAAGMALEGLKGQLLKGASNAPLASRSAFKISMPCSPGSMRSSSTRRTAAASSRDSSRPLRHHTTS